MTDKQIEFLRKNGIDPDRLGPAETIPPLKVEQPREMSYKERLIMSRDSAAQFYGPHDALVCMYDRELEALYEEEKK